MRILNAISNAKYFLKPGLLNELKYRLKNKFPQLTEADLVSSQGNESIMFRMVEYKLRKTKTEMLEIISEL